MPSPPTDLQTWIGDLRRAGELAEVEVEVDAELEVPEVHRRVIAAGGPALLFRRVRGSPFPLVTNLFGTRARVLDRNLKKKCFFYHLRNTFHS